jgi:hypothetical protein
LTYPDRTAAARHDASSSAHRLSVASAPTSEPHSPQFAGTRERAGALYAANYVMRNQSGQIDVVPFLF